ncbi:MAG: hypothetical protein ACRD3G_00890 [Vicinamibacterales bacterium]
MKWTARCTALSLAIAFAGCGDWFQKEEFLPTSPSVTDALALSVAAPSVPANGFSTVAVTATITADAIAEKRTIVFETTAGTFAGTGTPEQTTIERAVDSTGNATVDLRSSRTVESARVTARVKDVAGLSRAVSVSFTAAAAGALITVSASNSTVPADGATVTPIIAEISATLPAARRAVTFTTTLGRFVGDPGDEEEEGKTSTVVSADGGDRAVAYLRGPSSGVGTAFVTASVDAGPAVSATTSVRYVRAVPTQVLVTSNSATVHADFTSAPITVTATLVRDIGVPTEGTVVTFKAVDVNGVERGIFTKVQRSNAQGVATAEFSAGDFAALGPMTITATAEGVSGSTTVQVVM